MFNIVQIVTFNKVAVKIICHIYEIKLQAYIPQARYEEVLNVGLPVLKMLGTPTPAKPNLFHILAVVRLG